MKYRVQKTIEALKKELEKTKSKPTNKIIYDEIFESLLHMSFSGDYEAYIWPQNYNAINKFEEIFLPIIADDDIESYIKAKEKIIKEHNALINKLEETISALESQNFTKQQLIYALEKCGHKLKDNFIKENKLVIVYDNGFKIAPDSKKYKFKTKLKKNAWLQLDNYKFLGVPDK